MNPKPPIIEALADVKELRRRVLGNQLFYGYSGQARIAGGCIALVGALILSLGFIPATPQAHVVGWGTICAMSAIVNFTALIQWQKRRDVEIEQLRPVLDLIAPFIVGGLLTFSFIWNSQHDLLFPMWMWLFGLMNISSRHCLPRSMVYLGWYYILAGVFCIISLPYTKFTNPWPMGLVFFIGELLGGISFIQLRKEEEV